MKNQEMITIDTPKGKITASFEALDYIKKLAWSRWHHSRAKELCSAQSGEEALDFEFAIAHALFELGLYDSLG